MDCTSSFHLMDCTSSSHLMGCTISSHLMDCTISSQHSFLLPSLLQSTIKKTLWSGWYAWPLLSVTAILHQSPEDVKFCGALSVFLPIPLSLFPISCLSAHPSPTLPFHHSLAPLLNHIFATPLGIILTFTVRKCKKTKKQTKRVSSTWSLWVCSCVSE